MAGIKKLVAEGVIEKDKSVVAILTGHLLKDTDYVINYHRESLVASAANAEPHRVDGTFTNHPVRVKADVDRIREIFAQLIDHVNPA